MKRSLALCVLVSTLLGVWASPALAAVQDTAAQVPSGIAVGPGLNIEVSFPNMANSQGCGYNGAFVIDGTVNAASRQAMLQLLLAAKEHGWKVRVRLSGCSDRPKFHYVFIEPSWLPG
ncbi:MAG: hypothetical protein KDD47_23615 [Acidobacteria bacterium]|nr:hypothetical protein [Acidobacteriota bacterium]